MRIFGNLLFHAGCNALLEVFRQAAQGIKPFRSIRPHIHVHCIHRNDGHQDFFPFTPFTRSFQIFYHRHSSTRQREYGNPYFYLMSDKSCLGNMFEIIGTRHYRHAAKQHKGHQGSRE